MASEESEDAAIKIQALFRGNKGRDRAVQELEALMEAELEYAVNKAQSLSGAKSKRKENYGIGDVEEDTVGSSTPFAEMGGEVNEENVALGPTPGSSKEVYQQHKVVADALNIDAADIEQRAIERVKRTAPGLYKKKDLIQHIKKLQERVADIQNVVESVVPVVQGQEGSAGQPSLPSMVTRNFRSTTNGRKLTDLKMAIFGLDGIGAVAAEMFARSNVGGILIADMGSVEEEHIKRLYYQQEQMGLPRCDAAKLCINDFAPQVAVEAMNIDLTGDDDKRKVEQLLEQGTLASSSLGIGSVDIVIDCLDGLQREALAELCAKTGKTRVECGIDRDSACAFYRFHVDGATTEQAFDLPPVDSDAAEMLWNTLLPSTFQTIAGLAVQNALKYLMEAGKVTSAVRYSTMSMRVDSREMSF